MKAIITDKNIVVVGLGKTGLSCVRHLSALGKQLTVMDTREQPPGLDELRARFPGVKTILGRLDQATLLEADEIILSPGLSLKMPEIAAAQAQGKIVRGDIDLFAEAVNAPLIAITGSNGKSTVTSLLGDMAKQAGMKAAVGGNLGTPALDLLSDDNELYVMELSSFQLETTEMLNATSVVLLNLSEDHMDRYANKFAYLQAKQRIFRGATNVVVNDDEVLSAPLENASMNLVHYGLHGSDLHKFSTADISGELYIVKGFSPLMPIKQLKLRGDHNISNALAALALGDSVGIPVPAMVEALKDFQGLAHRCQFVRVLDGVEYFNDSKGTNPGAVLSALNSLGKTIAGKVILIAGGDSKGADLSVLIEPVRRFVKAMVLIGVDADKFINLFESVVPVHKESAMSDAVQKAHTLSEKGDLVLLSPACASLDMFNNFEHRGDVFHKEVCAL